jgi:large subunit ribosomal protein L6
MSRVGNNPIAIPEGVVVDIQSDQITVKGKLGELSQPYDTVIFSQEDAVLTVSRPLKPNPIKQNMAYIVLWSIIWSKGFQKDLLKNWNLSELDIVLRIKDKS